MGLAGMLSAWQRQTKDFGHSQSTNGGQSSKYTVLVFDNRGMGKSGKPLTRYSTSEMALDTLELLNHVGWKGNRRIHVVGSSMGGMISQELAMLIPERIASLSLLSTAPMIFNTTTRLEYFKSRLSLVIPTDPETQSSDIQNRLFSKAWLSQPDAEGHFPTNGDRFKAQEVMKRSDPDAFTRKGFLLQLLAAAWHHKSPEQLKVIGDLVGRDRIQVVHGTADNMVSFPHGELLYRGLGGPGSGVTFIPVEDRGHGLQMEWRKDLTRTIADMIEKTNAMT